MTALQYWGREIWRDLITPCRYPRDPITDFFSQVGKLACAGGVTLMCAFGWREATGEMPGRMALFLAVVLGYALAIEVLCVGWDARDSWADSAFVALGAGLVVWPVREVAVQGDGTLIWLEHRKFLVLVAVAAVFCVLRAAPRVVRKMEGGDGQ